MLQSESPPSSENDPRCHARSPSPSCGTATKRFFLQLRVNHT
ncbi:hypothetical protein FOPG_20113 [Fusarium oxysporum f. sp. conglutinans race 2 54008]|uniref:Uncharacterized protein n=1 Tax=Fusarium oxysporum f. sp. conglutinans race 2 54008 TaxID=1089457 RepID=X0GJX6_FUSOX|nr:hypothetical protein FOPG_20113 [Fusarium oxysporum f. sp. conglutinans race 2 54008]